MKRVCSRTTTTTIKSKGLLTHKQFSNSENGDTPFLPYVGCLDPNIRTMLKTRGVSELLLTRKNRIYSTEFTNL